MFVGIYSPNKVIYEGETNSATFPAVEGQITILNNHAPLITYLKKGKIMIKLDYGYKEIEIEGGILHCNGENEVKVIV